MNRQTNQNMCERYIVSFELYCMSDTEKGSLLLRTGIWRVKAKNTYVLNYRYIKVQHHRHIWNSKRALNSALWAIRRIDISIFANRAIQTWISAFAPDAHGDHMGYKIRLQKRYLLTIPSICHSRGEALSLETHERWAWRLCCCCCCCCCRCSR